MFNECQLWIKREVGGDKEGYKAEKKKDPIRVCKKSIPLRSICSYYENKIIGDNYLENKCSTEVCWFNLPENAIYNLV